MLAKAQSERFYAEMAPFDRFDDFVDFGAYQALPDDWMVLMADVVNSTGAIEAGRYKEVNMVGAASIMAVLNVVGDLELPYVFGGDGGTLAVPGSLADRAAKALRALSASSPKIFGLDLRVGAIPVAELRHRGAEVALRKFRLSPGNHLALFAGGGLALADELLKDETPDNPWLLPMPNAEDAPDLQGLSCRWEPLEPQKGQMLTLMIKTTAGQESDAVDPGMRALLNKLSAILQRSLQDAAPASPFSMRFVWPPKGLKLEARATAGARWVLPRYSAVLLSSLIQWFCERFDLTAGPYEALRYRQELRANTDFRKYDGLLRCVLDVSAEEAGAIIEYLESEYRAGRLVYGHRLADSALMTCLVFDLTKSAHIHFIDGSSGGFALAAREFNTRRSKKSAATDGT
jgi:hypothetical protein